MKKDLRRLLTLPAQLQSSIPAPSPPQCLGRGGGLILPSDSPPAPPRAVRGTEPQLGTPPWHGGALMGTPGSCSG